MLRSLGRPSISLWQTVLKFDLQTYPVPCQRLCLLASDPDLDPDLDLDPDPDPGDQGLARHFVVGRGYSAVVDRQTYNGKAAGVAGELSSLESTFCADSCFAIRSIPALPQQRVKDPKCR